MCEWCLKHGEGGKWYLNTQNYALKMYRLRKKELEKKGERVSPHLIALDVVDEAIQARALDPARFPALKKKAEELCTTHHFGQVIPLEDAEAILEIAYPLVRMSCACRREVRGFDDKESFYCLGFGVGMYKWERWPENYRGGVEFLAPKDAQSWVRELNKRGFVHSFWTFGTPYIGGICNCEYPACMGIRGRLDYGIKVLLKGEYVAQLDSSKCTGCGNCLERCQFGALKMEVSLDKVAVAQSKCFGCGLCVSVCKRSAITLAPRENFPVLAQSW